jgi:DNA-binding NarL/FixJ family response regulator
LIADDHRMVRQGLVGLLNAEPDLEVVGEAADGRELVQQAGNIKSDVILADAGMPNMNGIEAASTILRQSPEIKIVILSDNASSLPAIRALRSGALGYVGKNEDFQQVVQAIKAVTQGHRYISGQVVEQIINAVIAGTNLEDNEEERISDREKEILQLIAGGNTSQQIAKKLDISKRTVETHRTNIMRKLGLSSQLDILRFAIRHGLISPE